MDDYNESIIEDIKFQNPMISSQCFCMTGYFKTLVESDVGLDVGKAGWYVDENERFIVIMVTSVGNVVFCQQHKDNLSLIDWFAPDIIERFIPYLVTWDDVLQWARSPHEENAFQDLFGICYCTDNSRVHHKLKYRL